MVVIILFLFIIWVLQGLSFYRQISNSELLAYETVSLPIFPGMTDDEVNEVCRNVINWNWSTRRVERLMMRWRHD